jgi:aminocarboxymuconate-semialdehyde decarboxylase
MDEHGIDVHVLSPLPDLLAYWAPPDAAVEWCRAVNDWTASAVRAHPHRFEGFGILPMQDPEAAANMLDEVVDGPLCGLQLGTNINGTSLTDRRFAEIFSLAAAVDLCIFVHATPSTHCDAIRKRSMRPELAAAAAFPGELASIGLGLIACADPVRPRIALSHCGGGMPLLLGRLQSAHHATDTAEGGGGCEPESIARQFWYDSLAYDEALLRAVVSRVGPSQLLAGSDYPSNRRAWPEDIAAMSAVNAAAFLGPRSKLHGRSVPTPESGGSPHR